MRGVYASPTRAAATFSASCVRAPRAGLRYNPRMMKADAVIEAAKAGDADALREMLAQHEGRSVLYGLGGDYELRASSVSIRGLSSEFDCHRQGRLLGRFKLNLGGSHNVYMPANNRRNRLGNRIMDHNLEVLDVDSSDFQGKRYTDMVDIPSAHTHCKAE